MKIKNKITLCRYHFGLNSLDLINAVEVQPGAKSQLPVSLSVKHLIVNKTPNGILVSRHEQFALPTPDTWSSSAARILTLLH